MYSNYLHFIAHSFEGLLQISEGGNNTNIIILFIPT